MTIDLAEVPAMTRHLLTFISNGNGSIFYESLLRQKDIDETATL